MGNSIQLYSNETFSVRTTKDEDGTVWFVGKDIAEALEYPENSIKQLNNLFSSVPTQWKGHKRIMTVNRGAQEMLCLTEQGVYFFLGRSDKPKALPYQMWIAGDVVPSIHETGGYLTNQSAVVIPQGVINEAKALLDIAQVTGNQQILALDKLFKSYTGKSALQAADIQLISPTQKQLLTPTEIGKGFGLSARRVNELLAGAGYQHKIAGKWEALGDGATYAVIQDTNKRHSDGTPVCQLKWSTAILPVFEGLLKPAEEAEE